MRRRFDGGVGRDWLDARPVEKRERAVNHGVGCATFDCATDAAPMGAEDIRQPCLPVKQSIHCLRLPWQMILVTVICGQVEYLCDTGSVIL